MRLVPRRNWFGASIAAALLLLFAAGLLWLGTLAIAKVTGCPGTGHDPAAYGSVGLDRSISVWPPGAVCVRGHHPPRGDEYVRETTPPLKWAIVGLALGAPLTLLAGAVSEVSDQRAARRVRRSATGLTLTRLRPAFDDRRSQGRGTRSLNYTAVTSGTRSPR
jgi:hypothetical protein